MSSAASGRASTSAVPRVRVPWTLWAGLVVLVAAQVLLFVDVVQRGGAMVPDDVPRAGGLPEPSGALGHVARRMAMSMTPVCWLAYLFVADGLLAWLARRRDEPGIASIRHRPNRFVVAWLTSIPVWCFFDWVNFYWIDAWRYHGLSSDPFASRVVGYFIAFAAISPGMFLAAQFYQHLGMRRLTLPGAANEPRTQWWAWGATLVPPAIIVPWVLALLLAGGGPLGESGFVALSAAVLAGPAAAGLLLRRSRESVALLVGVSFLTWTLLARDPVASFTLWLGMVYLLDPINAKLGGPSLMRDWSAGRFGRTLALFAGGATCGLLWEFWNYWALTKWTYHLPFFGRFEQVAYFEMPVIGFLGFLPFAAECWVMLNTILLGFERLRVRVAERLPDEDAVL